MKRTILLSLLACLLAPGCNRGSASTGRISSLSLSPDGKLIVVTYSKPGSCFIYKVTTDTGNATRLTQAKDGCETSPAFSNDGKLIAFSYTPQGATHPSVVIINVDGSRMHSLAAADGDWFFPMFGRTDGRIYYGRSQFFGNYSPVANPAHHDWDIFSADIDGSDIKQLTHGGFYHISQPSLSPDGKNLVFVADTETGSQIEIYSLEEPAKLKLILQPHVPGEPVLAGKPSPQFNNPVFTADQRSILFLAASQGRSAYDYDVYRMDLGTGFLQKLTKDNGFSTELRTSADGKTVMFLKWRLDWHSRPVTNELYSLDLRTGALSPLKVAGLGN